MLSAKFSGVAVTRVCFDEFPSDETFVGKEYGAKSGAKSGAKFHDDTQRQEKMKKPLTGRSVLVERMRSKKWVLDASQYLQDQEDERARRERDLDMSNAKSSDAPLPRDWADQSSSNQKSQINDHSAGFRTTKEPRIAKIVKFERVESKKDVLDASQYLLDQRDEQELKSIANAWPSLSCTGPSNLCLVEMRIAKLEFIAATKNESIISLMDRIAILEENLCERENMSSEKEKTFAHVDAEWEHEDLKREVRMLRAASVEKDKRIAELRRLKSNMTKMILRLQRWNASLLPTSPSASMVNSSDHEEEIIKELQQIIAAKDRMIKSLKTSLRDVGASDDEYAILTPESSDDEEKDEKQAGEVEEKVASKPATNMLSQWL